MKQLFLTSIFVAMTMLSFAQIPTNGLVAEYLFTNGSYEDTNPNGEEPNDATGTETVSSIEDRFGNANSAKDLTGIHGHSSAASYINLGASNALKPTKGTISIWARIDKISTSGWGYLYNPIIVATNSNNPESNAEAYALYLHMEEKYPSAISINPPETRVEAKGEAISFKEWHHYAITYDDSRLKLYVDGVLVSDRNKEHTTTFSEGNIYVGGSRLEVDSRALDGQVDDIRIYNRVLSAIEIGQLKNEANPAASPVYTKLKDLLDAGYYPITGNDNAVHFYYKENYKSGNLNFKVYKEDRTILSGTSLENIDLSNQPTKRYGTNRYKLALPNLVYNQFYLLEVTNEKGEKQFLRFKRI